MIIIVGYGYFGKILKSKINDLNMDVLTVDPFVKSSDYKYVQDVPEIYKQSTTFWFITTPATSHKDVAIKLITECYARRIWIEKPICTTLKDTNELDAIAHEYNVYLYCDFTWLQHEDRKSVV